MPRVSEPRRVAVLEWLTKLWKSPQADDATGHGQQSQVDIDPAFEAGPQFSHAGKPGMRAFNYPAVSAQAIVAFHALAGDTWGDPSSLQVVPAPFHVVGLVGMQLVRPASWPSRFAGNGGQCIDPFLEHDRIVPVGPGHAERQGDAVPIRDHMPLAAAFAAVGRVRPRMGEATLAASRLARLKSSRSARRS